MDITKRFDRILKLYFLLQAKSAVSLAELRERFGTSERTIYRDIKALEAAGIPVQHEAGSGYAIMEGFRIQPSRFSQEELLSLVVAEKMMQQHETGFIKQHFDAALVKVKSSFRFRQKSEALHLEDRLLFQDHLRSGDYLPEVLDVLLRCILEQKVAGIHYLKRDDEQVSVRQIEPVGAYHEGGSWYVLAYCHARADYRTFRLDRIRKIAATETAFTRTHPPVRELRARDAAPVTHIIVTMDRAHAHNLYWDRHHFGFEQEVVDGTTVTLHFRCTCSTHSFLRWFLMFADMGEITAPAHLRQELAGLLAAALHRTRNSAFSGAVPGS